MIIDTNDWIAIILLVWFGTYALTKYKSEKKFDQELKTSSEKYEHKISPLEDKLKNSAKNYESLNAKHEELLNRLKNEEERYYKLLTEKYTAERHIANLQKDLYCARKHARKITKDFVSILSKLLGVN